MSMLLHWFSEACLLAGSFLLLTGALGFLRFPDVFSRIHACGVTETLATSLILLALLLKSDAAMPQIKLLLIFLFLMFSGPAASQALAKAAWHVGLRPRNPRGEREASASSAKPLVRR